MHRPTHVKGSILDLLLTNNDDLIHNTVVHLPGETPILTDHFMVSYQCRASESRNGNCRHSTLVYDFPKADWTGLCNHLLNEDFSVCLELNDVELIWATIKTIITSDMTFYIPKIRLKKHQLPVWFTPDLRHRRKFLRSLCKKCMRSSDPAKLSKLQSEESSFQSACKAAKAIYTASNSSIYKYINYLRKGDNIPSTMYHGSTNATSDEDRDNLFNKYFYSVFTQSTFTLPPASDLPTLDSFITSVVIPVSEVYEILSSLDTSKAMGLDGIGPNVLKHWASALCEPLQHLFNVSLRQHNIPAEWKIHNISPIHKSVHL